MVAPDWDVGMVELAMLSFKVNLNLVQGQGSRSSCKTSSLNQVLGLHPIEHQALLAQSDLADEPTWVESVFSQQSQQGGAPCPAPCQASKPRERPTSQANKPSKGCWPGMSNGFACPSTTKREMLPLLGQRLSGCFQGKVSCLLPWVESPAKVNSLLVRHVLQDNEFPCSSSRCDARAGNNDVVACVRYDAAL